MNYPQSIDRLLNILQELREKCPWDKKQTIHSLRPQTIEELYELTDALKEEDWPSIKEELGDLLLHIVFYSKIAEEKQQFSFEDVLESISNKLVRRHPHIYNTTKVKDELEVKRNWEQIKLKEGKSSLLSGVAQTLPPLSKSLVLQRKVQQVGFEWDNLAEVETKVKEEWDELQEAIALQDVSATEEEFGDLLFSLVNYARFLKIDPEEALERTNKKFKFRFEKIEEMAFEQGRNLKDMNLKEMDALWEKAKLMSKP